MARWRVKMNLRFLPKFPNLLKVIEMTKKKMRKIPLKVKIVRTKRQPGT